MAVDKCVNLYHPSALVRRLLTGYGWLIAKFARWLVASAFVLWLFCVAGFYLITSGDHLRDGYLLAGSQAEQEWHAFKRFSGLGEIYLFVVYVVSRDADKNLLRADRLSAIAELNEHLLDSCGVADGNESRTFSYFCQDTCQLNDGIGQFQRGYELQSGRVQRGQPPKRFYNLSYPISKMLGQSVDLRHNIFGVKMKSNVNDSSVTDIESFEMAVLNFRADRAEPRIAALLEKWELNVHECIGHFSQKHPNIEVVFGGDYTFLSNFIETSFAMIPYLVAGFTFMVIFVHGAMMYDVLNGKTTMDWKSTLIVSTAIIGAPCMAATGTFGLMFWLGDKFVAISIVVPFLTIAVGVDDAFLMVHAWNRLNSTNQKCHCNMACDNKKLTLEGHGMWKKNNASLDERFAELLSEVGTSMIVTSTTNAAAFAVGATSPMATLRTFCRFAAVSMVVDIVYQLVLFAPAFYLILRWQNGRKIYTKAKIHCGPHCAVKAVATNKMDSATELPKTSNSNSTNSSQSSLSSQLGDTSNIKMNGSRGFLWRYCSYLSIYWVQIMVVMFAVAHFIVSGYNFSLMTASFSPRKLFAPGSVSNRSLCIHCNYTNIHSGTVHLINFGFITTYENGASWRHQGELVKRFRQIAKSHKEFSVSIVDKWGYLIELMLSLKALSMRDIIITVICMALLCLIFIPSLLGVLTASFAVCSICIGVLGWLHLWSMPLDPISQATVLMSIGFSVDYTAHVTCHFFSKEAAVESRTMRLYLTLDAVAPPMIKAGLSTLSVVAALWLMYPLHVAIVFVKTVTLVVALGLLHGLLVVPALLMLLTGIGRVIAKGRVRATCL